MRRPISWHGVSPVFLDGVLIFELSQILTFVNFLRLFGTSVKLQLVQLNTGYSKIRSKCFGSEILLQGNHRELRTFSCCCGSYSKQFFYSRSWMLASCVVFTFLSCCVALDPPNLNLTQNKAHILPPCQACKSLVGSFKKVSTCNISSS